MRDDACACVHCFLSHTRVYDCVPYATQVMFHIYEDAELKPLLDAVNEEREKEKENES